MDARLDNSHAQLERNDAIVSRLAQQDNIPWYNKPNLRLLYLLLCPACIGVEMTSGFAASMTSGLQAVSSWLEYYGHPHSTSLGLMVSMYYLGSVVALPFAPFVVDRIGRRYPILLGGIISIVGGILQGSALSFTIFLVARFLLGFASIFCVLAASSLVAELSHPNERAIVSSIFNTSYDLGSLAAAVVTFWTFDMASNWGWRIPSFIQIIPSLLQVSFVWFLPESPRWLIYKGRGYDAYTVLVKYHAEGDQDSVFVNAEYAQITEALEEELKHVRPSSKDVSLTPGMRKRIFIAIFIGLCIEWSGVGLIASYLPLILDTVGIHDNRTKNIINLSRHFWSLINSAVIAIIVPQYPRRRTYLACTISVFVVFTAWTIATAQYSSSHDKVWGRLVILLVFVYSPAFNLAFNSLTYTYLAELFPFHARVGGIATYQWSYRCAAFLGQLVNPIGIETAGWRWYTIYCVWNAFQILFVYLMFPETSGRTLEELTFLFEEDRDVFEHSDVEILRDSEREGSGAYGTMENHPGRLVGGEQG